MKFDYGGDKPANRLSKVISHLMFIKATDAFIKQTSRIKYFRGSKTS